ncbi:MAG: transposase, partial [Paracoccaceae bacterium]
AVAASSHSSYPFHKTRGAHPVRAAIQRSQAWIAELSRALGITPKAVAKWRKRHTVEDQKTGPQKPRSTVLSEDADAMVWKSRTYRALKSDCTGCELKAKCCPNAETRSIHRDKFEIVRDFARQCTASDFNPKAQARRKKVEMLFAHLKRILGLGRLRLRGPSWDHGFAMTLPGSACGVQDEFTLAATAQNLRKRAKLKPMEPDVA